MNISNEFLYSFTNKLNLKNPNENMALANLSIYYTWKNINNNNTPGITINLKYLHQHGMKHLICLMVHILLTRFKITMTI